MDFRNGTIEATKRRIDALRHCLDILSHSTKASARLVARLAGYLISMSLALGPVCRLRTRAMYRFIESRETWSAFKYLPSDVKEEISFWSSTFYAIHGQPMWKITPVKAVFTWSDASDSGWGGFCLEKGMEVARGDWPEEVLSKNMSSTWRELRGSALVLLSLAPRIAGSACIHRSDNQAAVHIITYGSRKAHLQAEALAIHRICQQHAIQLSAEWIPREENELADYYSKVVDVDDWQLNPHVFAQLDKMWGPHTIDCFASCETKQLERYCSRWWNPGCAAVDAFTISWEGECVWLSPPVYLVGRILKMLEVYQCHGTLIVPKWVSASWWPLLSQGDKWHRAVKDILELPVDDRLFLQGSCPWNLFGNGRPKCVILALRLCTTENCTRC